MKSDTALPRPMFATAWLRFLSAPLAQTPAADVAVASIAVGALFDVAIRAEVIGVAGAACIALAAIALLATGRVHNPQAIALIAAAPLFGMWLLFRTSDWLIPFDILAAAGLLGFGASLARGGSGADMTIPELAGRVARGALQAFTAPAFLYRSAFGTGERRAGGIVRGLVLVVPIVLVVGALLTSADAVFASFFEFDTGSVGSHALLFIIGTLGMAALLRVASSEPVSAPAVEGPKLGHVESAMVLVALNVMLGGFAAARLFALSEGGQRVLQSAGLTYAEYARSGFFQLVFVALIVIATLLALRATTEAKTAGQRRAFTALCVGVVALTLAVCVSAFHRLVLYESAFGLTMLRLYVQVAIVWVALVLVALGVAVCVPSVRRAWLAPAAAVAGLVLLFALNVLNPEAFVAKHNVTHPPQTRSLDSGYLSELSDDATPAVAPIARGTKADAVELRSRICGSEDGASGWASYNVARARADAVREELCR